MREVVLGRLSTNSKKKKKIHTKLLHQQTDRLTEVTTARQNMVNFTPQTDVVSEKHVSRM